MPRAMDDTPRILVVDDDAVTRHILLGLLERAGFHTVALADGTAALDVVKRRSVSLVLLDLMLPPPDGYAVLESLREDPVTRDVPVLVLTALEGDREIARAFEAGADDFIRKPVREVELMARIRAQLRLRSYLVELARKERDAQVMVELTRALSSSLDFHEVLFSVVGKIAEVARVARCSIVVAREGLNTGYVLADSDDIGARNNPVLLSEYPEIQRALKTREALRVDESEPHPAHPAQQALREQSARYPSLTVVPIADKDHAMGVLFLRAEGSRGRLDERELSFCQIVANTTAVALRNVRALEALREESDAVRAVAAELARTKEFLSGLIEASPDAIVAAGLDGVVLLFNSAAERIYGYARNDVVGTRSITELYADGAAREVMRRIRGSAEQRVGGMRIEVIARDGERIPIMLSAAMVTENGKGVATVGVFSDLRERMSMEQRLARVQEKLETTEMQMIAAELAGAAAHELNQPLTVIQLSGELLQRRSEEGSQGQKAAEVILREAARMAEIVRKIGSVTQYKTKGYFNTKILDIDSSVEPEQK